MPWTVADVDSHAKGLSAKQKRAWVAVANAALKKCQDGGGTNCDASAIKQANAVAQRVSEADDFALVEIGRTISRKTRDAIQGAIDALGSLLKDEADEAEPAIAATEAAPLPMDDSQDARRSAIAAALATRLRTDAPANVPEYAVPYPLVRDVFDAEVVYGVGGETYRCAYSIDADGAVTLGDPSPVDVAYVDAGEATPPSAAGTPTAALAETELLGDLVPLVEKAVRPDGTAEVKVIQAGWGSSGYYPAAVLKRDGPKAFPAGTHMYLDHPTPTEESERPERSLRDLVGTLATDAHWRESGPAGPGLYARARVRADLAPLIEELAPHIGVSIRALGKASAGEAEGRSGPVIESLLVGKSVDYVTAPGAGGAILPLFEAARGGRTTPPRGGHSVDEEQARALREANAGYEREITELRERLNRQDEAMLLMQVRDFAAATLRALDMPDLTRERLFEALQKKAPIKDGALDREAFGTQIREAVKAELAYLASATGTGTIRGMGGTAAPSDGAAAEADLLESFKLLGFSDESARVAANGRGR